MGSIAGLRGAAGVANMTALKGAAGSIFSKLKDTTKHVVASVQQSINPRELGRVNSLQNSIFTCRPVHLISCTHPPFSRAGLDIQSIELVQRADQYKSSDVLYQPLIVMLFTAQVA